MKFFRFLSILLPIYTLCAFASSAIIGDDYVSNGFEEFLAAIEFSFALIMGFASIPFSPILRILSNYFNFRLVDILGLPNAITLIVASVFWEIIFVTLFFVFRKLKRNKIESSSS